MTRDSVADEAGGFIAGTLVHTKEGLKPIEQIKVGKLRGQVLHSIILK